MSCAQFFDVANFGVAAALVVVVVVVGVETEVVVGEADFFFDPPQPATSRTQTTAKT
jgi:hypothetical protein